MIVLDTNIVAYFFRGEGQVANNLFAMRPDEIALPAVVVYELRYGFTRLSQPSKHLPKLVELLRWITVLPFETKTAEIAARIRVETESRGKPTGPLDTLIAATALQHSSILATRNVREFSVIRGLQLANWFDDPPKKSVPHAVNETTATSRKRLTPRQ